VLPFLHTKTNSLYQEKVHYAITSDELTKVWFFIESQMTMIKISDSIFNLKASDGFIQFARESKYSCKHQTAWEKT